MRFSCHDCTGPAAENALYCEHCRAYRASEHHGYTVTGCTREDLVGARLALVEVASLGAYNIQRMREGKAPGEYTITVAEAEGQLGSLYRAIGALARAIR